MRGLAPPGAKEEGREGAAAGGGEAGRLGALAAGGGEDGLEGMEGLDTEGGALGRTAPGLEEPPGREFGMEGRLGRLKSGLPGRSPSGRG